MFVPFYVFTALAVAANIAGFIIAPVAINAMDDVWATVGIVLWLLSIIFLAAS